MCDLVQLFASLLKRLCQESVKAVHSQVAWPFKPPQSSGACGPALASAELGWVTNCDLIPHGAPLEANDEASRWQLQCIVQHHVLPVLASFLNRCVSLF